MKKVYILLSLFVFLACQSDEPEVLPDTPDVGQPGVPVRDTVYVIDTVFTTIIDRDSVVVNDTVYIEKTDTLFVTIIVEVPVEESMYYYKIDPFSADENDYDCVENDDYGLYGTYSRFYKVESDDIADDNTYYYRERIRTFLDPVSDWERFIYSHEKIDPRTGYVLETLHPIDHLYNNDFTYHVEGNELQEREGDRFRTVAYIKCSGEGVVEIEFIYGGRTVRFLDEKQFR